MEEPLQNDALRIDEKTVLDVGSRFWSWTYGRGMSDREVGDAIVKRLSQASRESGLPPFGSEATRSDDENWVRAVCFAVKWADSGYPKIVTTGHRFAAALMCTGVSPESDVHLPWKAFSVSVPNGLLKSEQGGDYTSVRVWAFGENCNMEVINERGAPLTMRRRTFSDLLLNDDWPEEVDCSEWSSEDDRVSRLAKRLVVGCLFTLQHTANFKDRSRALTSSPVDRRGPPSHRVVVVGRPLAIDMRPAISRFISGRRETVPSVQTLVRGHYKRQVVGVSRSGRRVIWVEPYWRGPEDAPILARPYKVGPKDLQ